jgi:hypothetical protein
MATSLGKRRKKAAAPTPQDLVLALSKAVGIDLTQEYDPESFTQLWVDLYQSEDPDSYNVQGEYLYNLFVQLQSMLVTQQEITAIIPVERRTKVWYQHSLTLQDKTDSELVDDLLENYALIVKPVTDPTISEPVAFLAIEVVDNEVMYG